jgi:hypothetical protein
MLRPGGRMGILARSIAEFYRNRLGHDEQNARDGEKCRTGKPADAVSQDVHCDCETNNRHSQPEPRESQQQSPGENFPAWLAEEEQPIGVSKSRLTL